MVFSLHHRLSLPGCLVCRWWNGHGIPNDFIQLWQVWKWQYLHPERTKYGHIGVIISWSWAQLFSHDTNSDERQRSWMDEGSTTFCSIPHRTANGKETFHQGAQPIKLSTTWKGTLLICHHYDQFRIGPTIWIQCLCQTSYCIEYTSRNRDGQNLVW